MVAESVGPLWPRPPVSNPDFAIGVARGGLRWDGTHVIPVLELDDVVLSDPALVPEQITFHPLDLSNARTIAAEAQKTVSDALTKLIGSTGVAETVLGLLGLGATDAPLGQFANDPLQRDPCLPPPAATQRNLQRRSRSRSPRCSEQRAAER